jgi:hypothetical protein
MITEEALGSAPTAPKNDEVACRACGGSLTPAFEAVVLDEVTVNYERCETCGSLMLLNPHWLDRAYSKVIIPDPDTGALRRTMFVNRFLRRLRGAGILPPQHRSLDYGAGIGMLVRLERDRGIEAWGYDLYSTPKFAELFCGRKIPSGKFELITCIEVLEHTTNPVELLTSFRSMLKDDGVMVVSTEFVDLQPDPTSWHYLAKDHGQHITLFSQRGLDTALGAAGLNRVQTWPFENVPLLHLVVPKEAPLTAWKLSRLRLQHWIGEANYSSDRRV